LQNLNVDAIDLLQLHCPPTDLFYRPDVFGLLDDLVKTGKIRYYGVSAERVEEALKAIEFPGVKTVQIIFNCFRQRPAEVFFPQAERKKIGILARVPLASGLLTGKLRRDSQFAPEDHRNFNRNGQAFDVGETFSGVDYEVALDAVEQLRSLLPQRLSMTQFALKWILSFSAVSCAIPGGKTPEQVRDNCQASDLPPLSPTELEGVSRVYRERIAPLIHQRW
jgi:aryl-alcohol dehydrogenase-like predicted oxidoreductase